MARRRPTLHSSNEPGLDYATTYFRVLEATGTVRSLLHGRLKDNGNCCALGCYFKDSNIPINAKAIEEIASYNDSFPHLTMHERWLKVRKWLKFEVARLACTKAKGGP